MGMGSVGIGMGKGMGMGRGRGTGMCTMWRRECSVVAAVVNFRVVVEKLLRAVTAELQELGERHQATVSLGSLGSGGTGHGVLQRGRGVAHMSVSMEGVTSGGEDGATVHRATMHRTDRACWPAGSHRECTGVGRGVWPGVYRATVGNTLGSSVDGILGSCLGGGDKSCVVAGTNTEMVLH